MKRFPGTIGLLMGLLLSLYLISGTADFIGADFCGVLLLTATGAAICWVWRGKTLLAVLAMLFVLPAVVAVLGLFDWKDPRGYLSAWLVFGPLLLMGYGAGRLAQHPGGWRSRVAAAGLAVMSVVGALFWCGNPLAILHAEKTGQAYLQERYPGRDYYIEKSGHGLEGYFVSVRSASSVDTHFDLYMDAFGDVKEDTYIYVSSGYNTEERLCEAYRAYVQTVLGQSTFPEEDYNVYAELHFLQQCNDPYGFGIPCGAFGLDEVFDLPGLSSEYGVISVYKKTGEATPEAAAAYLRTLEEYLRAQNFPFRAVNWEGEVLLTPEDLHREDLAAYLRAELAAND